MVKEKEKEGLAAVTLCFLTGKPDPAGDLKALDEMRADLDKLGVSLPGGYDPDRVQQSIFRALHGNVGPSPSCVILNRKGEVAWYLNNPRNMDRKIARRVIERLLKEEK
jgi:hypothetical protein